MKKSRLSRRIFLKAVALFALIMKMPELAYSRDEKGATPLISVKPRDHGPRNQGMDADGISRVYIAGGGAADENMRKSIGHMGGIGKIIGKEDIVVLKPNAQWWRQGMTNTDAMRAFIEMVLAIPGFKGEIIIAENHQYAVPDSRGWTTSEPNGNFNLNELVEYFAQRGNRNVTKYHWQCAGPNPSPLQGDAFSSSRIVQGPGQGDGYVWSDEYVYLSPLGRRCMMSYPVFTSAYSGVTIDLKNGAWKDGGYTGQPVRLINFSAINHHSTYCGVTASVKNFMGIVDMTCGFQGTIPKDYWNVHYIGIRKASIPFLEYLPWRVKSEIKSLYEWKFFYHSGGALGYFMRNIRKADINIITAHWVGYGSRIDTSLSGYPKVVLAGKDPVALDYIAGKNILSPLTRAESPDNEWLNQVNDVTITDGPFYRFLRECNREGVGTLDEDKMKIITG